MSRFERGLFVFLVIVAVGAWAAVGYKFSQAWKAPLGPQLSLPTLTITLPPTPEPPTEVSATISTVTPRPPAGPTVTLIPGPPTLTPYVGNVRGQPACGGPETMTLLAIGSDTRAQGYLYGLADVIRLVRVDFVTPRVLVLEFPRDLWVEIPDISKHYDITHGKLNQAYLYGNKGMGYYTGAGEGPGLLARALDLNFGARPSHYVAANMQTFVKLVNALGGIDVQLDHNVDARKPDQPKRFDLYFPLGRHHLNGEQALMLARLRPNTVFGRADQQNRVLCALRDALLNPANLPKLPQIIDAFDGAIQTDLSPQQISQLACLATTKLEAKDITFVSFPTSLLTGARTYDIGMDKDLFVWEADFNILRTYVSVFNTGNWPLMPPVPIAAGQPNTITPEPAFSCP